MFTGIVQGIRKISAVEDIEGGRRLRIQLEDLAEKLQQGASVAVNGVCLTAIKIEVGSAEFDIIQESLDRSNLGALVIGDSVDIERACYFGDEVGGHQVTGHIDCTGKIDEIRKTPNNRDVVVYCEEEWGSYLIPKGWIAIDGVSLTVVDVGNNWFSISLIPETLEQTVLGKKTKGDIVNLEFDHTTKVIVRTVERMLPEIKIQMLEEIKNNK
ncbi:MAG: riboflavin synthase subunit alpha [SAR324 cluster bacterium]|nr:riboflavin synthase subunit alpha [SAR324 cluster bacterium]